ncbi:hypothetical protein GN244_ATG00576 [Phytophthora infestans]|uniref:Uncharacterized protein n=1 Tax=Phytophthora infestans TaxID=4787 RepID=A0A833TUM9_PHYIN|nr:hypothetical protein GN244_ATG00576 [Phytophthora infestans]
MSWQQNIAVQRAVQAPSRQEERGAVSPSGDSRILRYIKTLTNHQTNAKQQRMDQYLQKVKHTQQTEERDLYHPRSLMATNAKEHQDELKTSIPTLRTSQWEDKKPREQNRLSNRYSVAQSDRRTQENPRTNHRRRYKRPYEGNQGSGQLKKSKTIHQTMAISALDRFRFNSTWLQNNSQTSTKELSVSKKTQQTTIPAAAVKHAKLGGASVDPQMPPITLGVPSAEVQDRAVVQATARPISAGAQDVWTNSNQLANFQPPKGMQPETLDFQQEDFVLTYDPLSAIMDSVYF